MSKKENTKEDKKDKEDSRSYHWATVIYEESAPKDWKSIVADAKVSCFISPIHDKDVNPTGEPKKPHYHLLFKFPSKKSRQQMIELFESFGGVGQEKVSNFKGYARYLCHLDNPEKAKYNIKDVLCFGGLDYAVASSTDRTIQNDLIREIIDFIKLNNLYWFNELIDYCAHNNEDWYDLLVNSKAYVVKEYMKSYHKMNQEAQAPKRVYFRTKEEKKAYEQEQETKIKLLHQQLEDECIKEVREE